MELLSIQQFSLYANGGGSRILRRMYEGHESSVLSLCIIQSDEKSCGNISEKKIYAQPIHRRWMRSYLRTFTKWLRYRVLYTFTMRKLFQEVCNTNAEVIHIVDQWNFPVIYFQTMLSANTTKQVWVSFHDHFRSFNGDEVVSKTLWQAASRRLVISAELGKEYQKKFGSKNFEIITDGLSAAELSYPSIQNNKRVFTLYFAGLLHIDYIPLFVVLSNALDELTNEGYKFKLVFRGTQRIQILNDKKFEVVYLPQTLDNAQLKQELDEADVLYLPIKFTNPDFYLYSLSTKMVGYLGGCGTILYHGPPDSAACQLLIKNKAAICCTTLSILDMIDSLRSLLHNKHEISVNAKKLAENEFILSEIQNRFWQNQTAC